MPTSVLLLLSPFPVWCLFTVLFPDSLLQICALGSAALLIFTSVLIRDFHLV